MMINPDDEIFWREIRRAVDMVTTVADRKIEITRGNKQAQILVHSDGPVIVQIRDIEPPRPTLIAE